MRFQILNDNNEVIPYTQLDEEVIIFWSLQGYSVTKSGNSYKPNSSVLSMTWEHAVSVGVNGSTSTTPSWEEVLRALMLDIISIPIMEDVEFKIDFIKLKNRLLFTEKDIEPYTELFNYWRRKNYLIVNEKHIS